MQWPNQPEYLQLFSNEGQVIVKVKFASKDDSNRSMPDMKMSWQELGQIMNQETGKPYQYMYIDTYRCPIQRYEIDPVKNMLVIVVGKTELS